MCAANSASPVRHSTCQHSFIHVTVTQVSCMTPFSAASSWRTAEWSNSSWVQPAQPMTVISEANTRFAKRITASFHFSTPVTR